MTKRLLMLMMASALLVSAGAASAQEPPPETITIQSDEAIFSDVAYDASGDRLLVSSVTDGAVYAVGEDGSLTPVLQSELVTSASGLAVDSVNNRLVLLQSGFGAMFGGGAGGFTPPEGFPTPDATMMAQGGQMPQPPADFQLPEGLTLPASRVLTFDLATSEPVYDVDLSGVASTMGGLLGGVAVDASGNVYITDSLAAVLYRVDATGAPTFLSDSQFGAQGPGISGITAHPDGYLLVSKTLDGSLYRIDLATGAVQAVTVTDAPTSLSDLTVLSNGSVAALNPADSSLVILTSADGWLTASVQTTLPLETGGTALAANGNTLFVLQSGLPLDAMPQPDSTPDLANLPPVTSTILRFDF